MMLQQVRLWLTSPPLRIALLRRTKCFGVFRNSSFSPLAAGIVGGFFSDMYSENLVELLEVKLTKVQGPQ